MGVALPADGYGLQDAGVTQLQQHPLLAEAQRLRVVVGLDAAHKVGRSHHHLGEEIHLGVLMEEGRSSRESRGMRGGPSARTGGGALKYQ